MFQKMPETPSSASTSSKDFGDGTNIPSTSPRLVKFGMVKGSGRTFNDRFSLKIALG